MAASSDDIRPAKRQTFHNGSRHAGRNRGAGRYEGDVMKAGARST
jgi:hypothetical protein